MDINIPDPEQNRRMLIAIVLSVIVMIFWYSFIDAPMRAKQEADRVAIQKGKAQEEALLKEQVKAAPKNFTSRNSAIPDEKPLNQTREQLLAIAPRIKIDNGKLHGSISLVGSRFDDITLVKYRQKLAAISPEVVLTSPAGTIDSNFMEFGWASGLSDTIVPNKDSKWQVVSGDVLSATAPIELKWENGAGVTFYKKISLDKDYLFTVEQRVENNSGKNILLSPYGLINKTEYKDPDAELALLHLGPIGVIEGILEEVGYDDLRDDGDRNFKNTQRGWLGVSDKYWLKAIIPQENDYEINFRRTAKNNVEKFQVDFLGKQKEIASGGSVTFSTKAFSGAKELGLLESYSETENIPLLDRAVHFGWLYFTCKPLSDLLRIFHSWVGNFGVAIIMLTFVVKLCLFPLARKSYISMGKMRQLQPKMVELKERYGKDKVEFQKKMIELYRKEKVNPAAGCLPILLQMPIFLSLYRVIFTSIEMRHAPFFGWIHDLSAPDPTSFWNVFGLLPFESPAFLAIGILPIIMGVTMLIQQKLMPAPSDPMQAQMMMFMPLLFTVLFYTMPAGLVLYWCVSNILTIVQQVYFLRLTRKT